jgi:hypothetical protein
MDETFSDDAASTCRLGRAAPRRLTNWRGLYMIVGDPEARWRKCRVVDVSPGGAGLELFDAVPEETQGQRIVLALEVQSEVRYTRAGLEEELHVGTQFVDLSEDERRCIASLAGHDPGW